MTKRKSLGRGLDALLSTSQAFSGQKDSEQLKELPVDLLQRGKYQPRVDMKIEKLQELSESIKREGLVQPILVRPIKSESDEQRYEIVAGERRWQATQLAGLHNIPVIIKEIPDKSAIAISLIENIQREDLNPIEEARALSRLADEFSMTHEEVAETVGRSRAMVTNLLRLLDLPEQIIKMLNDGSLGMGHARAILPVSSVDAKLAISLAQKSYRNGWSVRNLENIVRNLSKKDQKSQKGPKSKDPDILKLEKKLADYLGAKVEIMHSNKGGKVSIAYHNIDELEGIIDHFYNGS
ncbi:MAG: hypothetical protein CBC38_02795 [Gammaproteobacteria bacterium TMED78]|nr:MAG: hypothetical protein CBC38_02795 [Gammaproteobacteria bacterium TMED78]|tara:strand:- start:70423 stop:71307 length:885 start_codon:yes stop_codon:yes gene_type:complete